MTFEHLMQKVRDAAVSGIGGMSTGEALSVALVLNRFDWLRDLDYTIAEALHRIDDETIPLLRQAERAWRQENEGMQHVAQIQKNAAVEASFFEACDEGIELDLAGQLVTHSYAPGYRDIAFIFDVVPIGVSRHRKQRRVSIRIRPEDADYIITELLSTHRFAWRGDCGPLDRKDGEVPPRWITEKL